MTACLEINSSKISGSLKELLAKESALSMYSDGLAVERIAKYVGYAVDIIKKWVGEKYTYFTQQH